MKLTFWGVRGSIPCPGPDTVHYGGNTASLEIRYGDDDKLLIVDAGSGIRPLGNKMMGYDLPRGPIKTSIFITHTHWDHIMGFPFFTPIYIPGTKLTVYGPVTYEEEGLDRIVGDQLSYRYFPIKHSELSADIEYVALQECKMQLDDDLELVTKYLNHPILCLGYRFNYKGKSLVTAYDTEPFRNVFPTDPEDPNYDEIAAEEGERAAKEENEKFLQFIKGADILIHDSQYTHKEYLDSKLGWGHTSFEYAINSAHKAGVKRLYLFHHDPVRTDDQLTELITRYKKQISGVSSMEVELAREGLEIEL